MRPRTGERAVAIYYDGQQIIQMLEHYGLEETSETPVITESQVEPQRVLTFLVMLMLIGRRSWQENMNVFDIDELSKRPRIPKKTIYKWAREKKIPCLEIGKHLRFIELDIDQWFSLSLG
jgi:excisionase family DNA binding protein